MDPTYASWAAMRRRCENPQDKDFHNYGGRGIQVCFLWRNFSEFKKDMGSQPEGLTLERINTSGDYEASNCKWATRLEQANNRRNNRIHEGKTAAQIAREKGRARQSVLYRMNVGLDPNAPMRALEAEHGTVSRYTSAKHKCRCPSCREAWRVYNQRKRG